MKILYLTILTVASYLIGNINFAKIISKCKQDDITKHGSGNPGTLNMLRTYGFKVALLNMLLEICKGLIPTLVGKLWLGQMGIYFAGTAVVLGHIFPVFSKFKGGKGVAAFAGFSLIALPWWVFLIVFAVCFIFVTITSIGSIGTLGFVLISTIIQLCLINPSSYGWICYILLVLLTSVIMYVHRGNIKRLLKGKENPTNIREAIKNDMNKKKSATELDNSNALAEDDKNVQGTNADEYMQDANMDKNSQINNEEHIDANENNAQNKQ